MSKDIAETRETRLLRLIGPDPANWVAATNTDHDVVVVGGGQAGIGVGFGLRRAGIGRTSVIDAAAPGETGDWKAIARMRTLRTPKIWPEPEFGLPELSFRAWYEERHGQAAYDDLDRIPRLDWAAYIDWIESALGVPIRHHTRLTRVVAADGHLVLRLSVRSPDGTSREVVETTRRLVLASGVEGTGGPDIPAALAGLPRELAAHTGHRIDFERLAGRTVAVLGAGASAFDAAGAALAADAAQVHLFTRRPDLLLQGPGGFGPANLGARDNFHRRSDADRWRQKATIARGGRSTTLESVQRAVAYPGFRLHLAAPWHSAVAQGDQVQVQAADGEHVFDFVIAGTGYQYDPHARAELADVAGHVALWGDRYQPPAELADDGLARWPYLGSGYQFLQKRDGEAPWVERIHVFSAAAALSFGIPVGDAQSLATGVPRLVDAIGQALFFEDAARPAIAPAATKGQPAPAGPVKAPVSFRATYEQAIWTPARVEV